MTKNDLFRKFRVMADGKSEDGELLWIDTEMSSLTTQVMRVVEKTRDRNCHRRMQPPFEGLTLLP